jgi:DNA (cytosine-5)-methyltransferase 3A
MKTEMVMNKGINVLSLFDGISSGRLALNQLGVTVDNYYACEIDPYAIKIAQKNFPNTIQLGDVTTLDTSKLPDIQILIGGSPCQSFSVAGDGSGFDGKSKLFWEYVRILKEVNPKYFLLENVKMKKEWEDVITNEMGVTPLVINSKHFGAQYRVRLFWTNIPVDMDMIPYNTTTIGDILTETYSDKTVEDTPRNLRHERVLSDKSLTCTATMYKGAGNNGMSLVRRPEQIDNKLSVLNVTEVERLMNIPEGYTEGVSNTQRYKALGNGWDIEVIKFIFRNI